MEYAYTSTFGVFSDSTISLLPPEKYFYTACLNASADDLIAITDQRLFGALAAKLEACALHRTENKQHRNDICIPTAWAENSNFDQILSVLNKMIDRAVEKIDRQEGFDYSHQSSSGEDRNLDLGCEGEICQIPTGLDGIWNYGCWCNFGHRLMDGQGEAQNPHDVLCQRMQLCLRCAAMDAENDSPPRECYPKNQEFVAAFGFDSESLAAACSAGNLDPCARDTCTCQMSLIEGLVDLIWSGYVYDPQYLHISEGGSFDFHSECATKPGHIVELDCCGRYPARKPFHTGMVKSCCAPTQELYNILRHNCCSEGLLEIGEPCQ